MNSDNEEMSRISGILSKIQKRVTPEDRIAELEAEVTRLAGELAEARKLCGEAADEMLAMPEPDHAQPGETCEACRELYAELRAEAAKGGK